MLDTSESETSVSYSQDDVLNTTQTLKNSKALRIVHMNAESIRNKMDILACESEPFDIICLGETWLKSSIKNKDLKLPGFRTPIRKDRDDGWGGVAIYAREELYCTERKDLNINGLEAIWCEARFKNTKYIIGCMYRPPNSKAEYWELIEESIEHAKTLNPGKNIIITGDLNCDMSKGNGKLQEILTSFNMTQIIKEKTHITSTNATLIDIMACNCPDLVKSSGVRPPQLSKHRAIYGTFGRYHGRIYKYNRTIWVYKEADWTNINREIQETNWDNVTNESDIDKACQAFTDTYMKILKDNIPNKEVTIKSDDKVWMSNKIRLAKRKRDRAHRKASKSNTTENWNKYRQRRNNYTTEIRNGKEDYGKKLADKIKNCDNADMKTWWKSVNYFLENTNSKSSQNSPLLIDNEVISDNKQKAQAFNKYFVAQATLEEDTEDNLPEPVIPNDTLEDITISILEVKDMLKILKPDKASGPDTISPRVLKNTSETLAPILQKLFNNCLKACRFPDSWKLANVIPIHKKGATEETANYRPISLLSCVGKVFERCVCKKILNFFHEHEIITRAQAAYIGGGSSTITQLLEIYHDILKKLDEGSEIHFAFLDASKAFDRVWHKGLLYKLKQSGITGNLYKWFEDYLQRREQRVVIQGESSDTMHIKAGVPQGSILGPILFLIYVNDMPEGIESSIKLYADDTSIYSDHKVAQEANTVIRRDLERISKWSKQWKIKLNPDKTERLIISRKKNKTIPQLDMDGIEVKTVSNHKHLGLIIQGNGKWTNQIKETVSKAKQRIDILRGLMYKLDRITLEKLYTTYIRPLLEYGNVVWTNCNEAEKRLLEKTQLDAAKIITGAVKGTSHYKIYKECHWKTLQERRNEHQLVLLYKTINDMTPKTLKSIIPEIVEEENGYMLRNKSNIKQIKTKSNAFCNSFLPSTIKLWNKLDIKIKEQPTLSSFKRELKGEKTLVKKRFLEGKRKEQIIHARIRLGHSGLNEHLVNNHIQEDRSCRCGFERETAVHYFFDCPLYEHLRTILYDGIPNTIKRNIKNFLWGDDKEEEEQNMKLFQTIQEFITSSGRFP